MHHDLSVPCLLKSKQFFVMLSSSKRPAKLSFDAAIFGEFVGLGDSSSFSGFIFLSSSSSSSCLQLNHSFTRRLVIRNSRRAGAKQSLRDFRAFNVRFDSSWKQNFCALGLIFPSFVCVGIVQLCCDHPHHSLPPSIHHGKDLSRLIAHQRPHRRYCSGLLPQSLFTHQAL